MAFELENVVPWGRTLAEYRAMFALSDDDLKGHVLGCGDGPASFNAEAKELDIKITSVDPIYAFSKAQIQGRIDETYTVVMDELGKNRDQFVWSHFTSPEALGEARMSAMTRFLADFVEGKRDGRYIEGALPELDFSDSHFELALCSHFLFLYSDQFDTDFHIRAVRELCRVADEVRIFPLFDLSATLSRHVEPVIEVLRGDGFSVSMVDVDYEFQKGATQMLRITR